jgi:hypothetical protein
MKLFLIIMFAGAIVSLTFFITQIIFKSTVERGSELEKHYETALLINTWAIVRQGFEMIVKPYFTLVIYSSYKKYKE